MSGVMPLVLISPPHCGEARLAGMLRDNGLPVACHEGGALAEDIVFAQATGTAPLTGWRDARLIAGLYRDAPPWRVPLEAWRCFAFLDRHLPDARFVLAQRDPDAWLLDRLLHDDGRAARSYAHHHAIPVADVPERWLADWDRHQADVLNHFGGSDRLLRLDLGAETPLDVFHRLRQHIPLSRAPDGGGWHGDPGPNAAARLDAILDGDAPDPPPDTDRAAREIADFCLRGIRPGSGRVAGVSQYYVEWDGRDGFADRHGDPAPHARAVLPGSARPVTVTAPRAPFKRTRCEGVLNAALAHGHATPLRVDMEDSRWIGSPHAPTPPRPVICHNRRKGAANVVLWPLPGLHDPGESGFDATLTDPIPFQDKLDRVWWRGMISGHLVTGAERPGPPSFRFLADLDRAGTDPALREKAWEGLSRTSRLAFVREYFDHPDFDLGVVMAWAFRHHARDPLLAPYCKPRAGRGQMLRYRYQLYMAGYDHGSNFIPAINSGSVLLKEEDGWEVFCSDRFKPWKHYIPLERYCADILEKLAWARKNPSKCKEMSEAARSEVALLSDPALRRRTLGLILDQLARSG